MGKYQHAPKKESGPADVPQGRFCKRSLLIIAAWVAAALIRFFQLGREEFLCGEFDPIKHFAGAVVVAAAFLLRNTEVVNRNKHLDVADQLHNGKNAQSNVQAFAESRTGADIPAQAPHNAAGQMAA